MVNGILITAGYGIKPAMSSFSDRPDTLNNNIAGEDGIEVIDCFFCIFFIDNQFRIEMKPVLSRMYTRICTGRACKFKLLPEVGFQGLFHFSLDGIGVLLHLETRIISAFVSKFYEVSVQGLKFKVQGSNAVCKGLQLVRRLG